jgi:hypothetical protein
VIPLKQVIAATQTITGGASATTINFLGWLRDNPTFFIKKMKKEGDE